MTPPPRVSILIPCFNRLDRTRECWKALPGSLPAGLPVEIIFIDNGSTDGTAEFLTSLESTETVRASVIRNTENLGYAKANNQGAARAGGEILVLLNNDTVAFGGWLDPLLELLDGDPAIGITGSKLLYPDGRIQHAGMVVRGNGTAAQPFHCHHIHRLSPGGAPWVNVQRDYQCVTAACMAVRRSLYVELGGLDEGYVNGFEDIDFCFRSRAAGYRVVYSPRSALMHYESSSQGRQNHDDPNTALFTARWRNRIAPDEAETYARAARPNTEALKAELQLARDSLDKIRHYQHLVENSREELQQQSRGLRARIRRWLGIPQAQHETARDLRNLRNTVLHLKRVTEGLALMVDYQDVRADQEHDLTTRPNQSLA